MTEPDAVLAAFVAEFGEWPTYGGVQRESAWMRELHAFRAGHAAAIAPGECAELPPLPPARWSFDTASMQEADAFDADQMRAYAAAAIASLEAKVRIREQLIKISDGQVNEFIDKLKAAEDRATHNHAGWMEANRTVDMLLEANTALRAKLEAIYKREPDDWAVQVLEPTNNDAPGNTARKLVLYNVNNKADVTRWAKVLGGKAVPLIIQPTEGE